MDERDRRLALNEAVFREVNERIHRAGVEMRGRGLRADGGEDFVCECPDTECTFGITLSESEYESVRSDGTRFVVAPDHALPEIEDVVEKHERYWVVAKRDDSGELVALLDPRRSHRRSRRR